MRTILLSYLLLAITLVLPSPVRGQQSCACAYYPMYQYPGGGGLWLYYGERIDVPAGQQCSQGQRQPISIVCDLSNCLYGGQSCSGTPCETCSTLNGNLACDSLTQSAGINDVGPATGDVLENLPDTIPDPGHPSGTRPHRASFTRQNEKFIRIRTNNQTIYAKIVVIKRPDTPNLFYGIQVKAPTSPPTVDTPIRLGTALCTRNGDLTFEVIRGLVVANVDGNEYMIRIHKDLLPNDILMPLRIVDGMPFAQPGYKRSTQVNCCGNESPSRVDGSNKAMSAHSVLVPEANRLNELEVQNRRLKELVAELLLEKKALEEASRLRQ